MNVKTKVKGIVSDVKNTVKSKAFKATVGSIAAVNALAVTAFAEGEATGNALATALGNIDLSVIATTLTSVIGPCLVAVVPIMAIRKGLSFVLGMIHGA